MSFVKELEELLNKHSIENGSNTPDFILAKLLEVTISNFNSAVKDRDKWYGVSLEPGKSNIRPAEAVMAFAAFITTQHDTIEVGATKDVHPIMERMTEFFEKQGWEEVRDDFMERIKI